MYIYVKGLFLAHLLSISWSTLYDTPKKPPLMMALKSVSRGTMQMGCANGALEVVGKVADGLKLFPGLTYLEIVKCPKLSLIPCDENGVWKNAD
ncbi:hypothetical protein L3X38_022427 [Prunus dulcis]|uniref:Uncharacterized protein n=1 Tax=Prunus dulcis TaxID=3755 RepID=A0AAD4VW35_PRUDU|nr:hypothetical protein L3X38_022427 [Prunus dulcis]